MTISNLKLLPKIRDSLSYLYFEHGKIEQTKLAVEYFDKNGSFELPIANLSVLMLGPGTSITHNAIKTITEHGCTILWTGEEGVRTYAYGFGESFKAYKLQLQAELVSDPEKRKKIALKMYRFRFGEIFDPNDSFEILQGKEGKRVKIEYEAIAKRYGLDWHGRKYNPSDWDESDDLNKALSTASSCLNGICCAAIVSAGYSPGLGFIHRGRHHSFVYDIADLYKTKIAVPVAFATVAEKLQKLETTVRKRCRQAFKNMKLLKRIITDIDKLLQFNDELPDGFDPDENKYLPSPWWIPPEEE